MSLFTRDPQIADEVARVFDFMAFSYKGYAFNHLIVSPNDVRSKLYALIDNEIANARSGKKARIYIKINNIDDREIIRKLYEASVAGVRIRVIVRGICSLVPGVPGVSDNISVLSIVGRFLEHPRFFIFHNGGEKRVYLSSADWMTRNLDWRVEVGCPILDDDLKGELVDIFDLQWSDTTKARLIDQEQSNKYKPRGNKRKINAQDELYNYFKQKKKLPKASMEVVT